MANTNIFSFSQTIVTYFVSIAFKIPDRTMIRYGQTHKDGGVKAGLCNG